MRSSGTYEKVTEIFAQSEGGRNFWGHHEGAAFNRIVPEQSIVNHLSVSKPPVMRPNNDCAYGKSSLAVLPSKRIGHR